MATTLLLRGQRLCLLAIATLLPLIAIAQGEVYLDSKALARQQTMTLLYAQTINCMHVATLAITQQGVTKRSDVFAFTVKMCGHQLYDYLTGTMGWEKIDAAELVAAISNKTIDRLTARPAL